VIRPTITAASLEVADAMPTFERLFTTVDLMAYGAATWDWHRLHYDLDYARAVKLPAVIVDGQALGAVCAKPLLDWLGPRAFIQRLSLKYRGMVFAGDTVRGEGEITAIRAEGEHDVVSIVQRLSVGDRLVAEARAEVRLPR
jgi:acyl dehydratase